MELVLECTAYCVLRIAYSRPCTERAGFGAFCVLRIAYCVLRIAYCVLRIDLRDLCDGRNLRDGLLG